MAIFNIDNAAGQGFYMPYVDTGVGDMIDSYSGSVFYNDGSAAAYDVDGIPADLICGLV